MSEVMELLKVWMEGSHRQEEKCQEEWKLFDETQLQEWCHYDEEREAEQEADWKQAEYEELIQGLMEQMPLHVEVSPKSLKLAKLGENDDTVRLFSTPLRDHGVERGTWAAILAPQLMREARLSYVAMSYQDAGHYDRVKTAIFPCYDIN